MNRFHAVVLIHRSKAMSLQFTATVHLTTRHADFVNHDGRTSQERREELPIGTPIAIDAEGNVYIPSDYMSDGVRESFAMPEMAKLMLGKPRKLFRDYWCSASININEPNKAGPYFHAVLNALPSTFKAS
jgi:hypothetical protein